MSNQYEKFEAIPCTNETSLFLRGIALRRADFSMFLTGTVNLLPEDCFHHANYQVILRVNLCGYFFSNKVHPQDSTSTVDVTST